MDIDFKLILITDPEDICMEMEALQTLWDNGLDVLHLRKPQWTKEHTEDFLKNLSPKYLKTIRLHDHYELADNYELNGIHLNYRNETRPDKYSGKVSYSCHSLAQVVKNKPSKDYVFLSPIFNSISKQNYESAFSKELLLEASHKGYIDNKVIALGGVEVENIPSIKEFGFGGAAILGAIWEGFKVDKDLNKLLLKWKTFQECAQQK